jgi:hypothetical protein
MRLEPNDAGLWIHQWLNRLSIKFRCTLRLSIDLFGRGYPHQPLRRLAMDHISTLRRLTWWLGKMRVSATTTFSRRVALKTMTSAMSLGVRGSTPLKEAFEHLSGRHSHMLSELTHTRRRPWTCRHRSAQQRIPKRM